MTHGSMDFDFRKRCFTVVEATDEMPEHQILYYGLSADSGTTDYEYTFDIVSDFRLLGEGKHTRRVGKPAESQKHYFNRSLRRCDFLLGGKNIEDAWAGDPITNEQAAYWWEHVT